MFWVISQEQRSIKTLEFTETNGYFYSFTYGKKHIWQFILPADRFFVSLLADRKAVDSTPKYSLLDGDTNQVSIFSPCIRYKWGNIIDWSTTLSLTRQSLIQKIPVFYLFHQLGKFRKPSLEQHSKYQFSILCKLGQIMYSLTPTIKNNEKTEKIYIK